MSNKSIRIRTKPGGDDNYIRVKLDQDFNQLKILSLSIDQEDLYRSFNANYGVVAGRIDINNGFGLKNAKVSIFIPLSTEDQENEIISQLYPYKSLEDLNSNGVRYNLLPRKQQHIDHTPTGTFPDKRQILDSPTMVEVYDKYYKFTTTTNESGDYMFFGVPVGSQQIFIDVDVSDIGFLSARPYELMSQGIPEEKFESKFKFKSSDKLDELPQVISTSSSVEVLPFWADDLSQGTEFGITRFDYSVTQYTLTPTAIFMGSMFSDNENDALSKNCRPRKKMGEMNDLITGAGKIEAITRTRDGEIVLSKDIPDDAVDENGNWAIQVPMTMRKLVTDEFGALVPSPDGKRGIASEADYRFRISMEPNKNDKKKRTRAKLLVPNMTNNYKFGEFSKIDLTNAEAAGEPIFKVNEQLSYDSSSGPLNQYNYLEDFFTFRWKKVYTVRQYIPRHQPNKNDKNKNFIGFKNISDAVGVNKLPFNRLSTKIHILYTIVCFILKIFGFIVAFINGIIQFINALISRICQLRIPFPCLYFDILTQKGDTINNGERDGGDEPSGKVAFKTESKFHVYDSLSGCTSGTNPKSKYGEEEHTLKLRWGCNNSNHKVLAYLFNQFDYGLDYTYANKQIGDSGYVLYQDENLPGPNDSVEGGLDKFCRSGEYMRESFREIGKTVGLDNDNGIQKDDGDSDYFGGDTSILSGEGLGGIFKDNLFYRFASDQGGIQSGYQVCTTTDTSSDTDDTDDSGCKRCKDTKFRYPDGQCGEETYRGFKFKLRKCYRVCFFLKFKIKQICIIKGLCDTCSNDDEFNNDSNSDGVNQKCCSGCDDCGGGCPNEIECEENCLHGCCEKIKPITLSCAEEGDKWTPVLWETKFEGDPDNRTCGGDKLQSCYSCTGKHNFPIDDWVACKLEQLATFLGMLDFEFYNDWMNGSLYFPLIKRKLKIKRAKKAAKGKSLKRGQGQIKKDVFCDYDCDDRDIIEFIGEVDDQVDSINLNLPKLPDYQHPDKEELYSVKIRKGGKVDFTFEGCKVNLPRRISAKQWYEDVNQVYKTIEFKGNEEDNISKGCTFTLEEYCNSAGNCPTGETTGAGVEIGNTGKYIKVKTKKVPGEHGKPKYIKIGAGTDGDGKKISVWENVGGHGHQKNKCKKNYFIEKEEYTKDNLSDCMAIPKKDYKELGDDGFIFNSDEDSNTSSNENPEDVCTLACQGQGTAACSKNAGENCECDKDNYNRDANYRGIVKWEDGEIYYVSIKDENDREEDEGNKGNFDSIHYKKNMFFPTNITELGSSVFCDIDEAPFIMDQLEPTTYKVSEEELSVSIKESDKPEGVDVDYVLKEKEGNINLRAYVDFGCTDVRCMNIRASLTEAQVGTELFDLNDTGLECGSCTAYVDVDTDIRQYFCQRFSTFVPETNGNTITNMGVNYMRPGGSQGENYYEPYGVVTGTCGSFSGQTAIVDGGTSQDDVFNIDNEINDNDPITPGDKCGYLTTDKNGDLDFENVKYFYGMDLSTDHTKNNLDNFPFELSKLGITKKDDVTNNDIPNDNRGITPFTTQTPYFFYFGLVPGKTALNKVVGKFFADKINAETLETISNGGTNETNVPPNSKKSTSPQSIVGSCINS